MELNKEIREVLPYHIVMRACVSDEKQFVCELKDGEFFNWADIIKLEKNGWKINYIQQREDRCKVGIVKE